MSDESNPIINITTLQGDVNNYASLIAQRSDGTMWLLSLEVPFMEQKWRPLPSVPDSSEHPSVRGY